MFRFLIALLILAVGASAGYLVTRRLVPHRDTREGALSAAQNATERMPCGPVVFAGDSLVSGVGASPGMALPDLVSQRADIAIENAGVSGDTSLGLLQRIAGIAATKPSLTIVLIGGNDFLRQQGAASFEANLRAIVRNLKDAGSSVVLVGLQEPDGTRGYSDAYARVAQDENVVLVADALKGIFGNSMLMSDQIHPNDAGYAQMADRIAPAVKGAITQLACAI